MAFDLDDEELEATRKLYGLSKKKRANTDTTYCTNETCMNKCWRHIHNWEFDNNIERYNFIHKCL